MTRPFPLPDAQMQMTLAAIAYAGDDVDGDNDPSITTLKAHIAAQLTEAHDPPYATDGRWSLVWGPIETRDTDNLAFLARDEKTGDLSLALRGTTTQFLSRIEDIPTSQTVFPTGNPDGATVSTEFLGALDELLTARVHKNLPGAGTTLAEGIAAAQAERPAPRVLVTGHSQGAALVPMMMLALAEGHAKSPPIGLPLQGFAFAPPTSGNPGFAGLVNAKLDCWFVVNPLDVVPLGYADIKDVTKKGIPARFHGLQSDMVAALTDFAAAIAGLSGPWAQPSQRAILEQVPLEGHIFQLIGEQHNHNAYLCLLGAAQTTVGSKASFPTCPLPDPTITTG